MILMIDSFEKLLIIPFTIFVYRSVVSSGMMLPTLTLLKSLFSPGLIGSSFVILGPLLFFVRPTAAHSHRTDPVPAFHSVVPVVSDHPLPAYGARGRAAMAAWEGPHEHAIKVV